MLMVVTDLAIADVSAWEVRFPELGGGDVDVRLPACLVMHRYGGKRPSVGWSGTAPPRALVTVRGSVA
jgi:hypothetical protein